MEQPKQVIVKSGARDYLVFVIFFALVLSSNWSDLNKTSNIKNDTVQEQNISNDHSVLARKISSLTK